MTQQIEVLDALPGSGKSYTIMKYISEHKDLLVILTILCYNKVMFNK